ncbi:GntR family transcriptional regulator [Aurantimonas coralicida]|uniref:GntR family transcriptional regulator n=1 Tax=Aurantimonas coralicida TaxID=182270 RepID=UPI001E520444|nr:GntR family transcriptional regulator [Aurantimonas coralicida]MCD1645670.1 GntR family transcriptional regulator [Aurantimonas coralicida]MDX1729532.1 GntR family transcriptional regulator [Aurantimonas coralicida]
MITDSEIPISGRAGTKLDLAKNIAEELEEDIVFGRLYPRERLIEEEICARFGTKRHTVREALSELERLGLIERVRNRGAVVRLYGSDEVREISQLREFLEGKAASLIPLPLDRPALVHIADLQEQHARAAQDLDTATVFRLNIRFHRALFSLCGNRALIEAIETWAQKSHAYRSILVADDNYLAWAVEDHRKMVEALRDSDRSALIALCQGHLRPARDRYVATYQGRFSSKS